GLVQPLHQARLAQARELVDSGLQAQHGRWAADLHIRCFLRRHYWDPNENVHFYGTHSVDIDGELAQLDADG
ncbi:hypothetical protein ABZ260_36110, partial [Streptosporangium sp. NPDC006013]|uniref:hypothetical protein n=1 Tax=Streptosporangium sp. NPDC006013 TaxID=3155596 RepID=UPI0033BD7792